MIPPKPLIKQDIGVNILHINANGANKKHNVIEDLYFEKRNLDVICVSETHYHSPLDILTHEGYSVSFLLGVKMHCGVCIWCHNTLQPHYLEFLDIPEFLLVKFVGLIAQLIKLLDLL